MQETYLTFVEGTSSKFWKATVEGSTLTTQWGKIGTNGQSQEKAFGSEAEALAALEKQKAEKVKKGYSGGTGDATAAVSPTPAIAKPVVAKTPQPATPAPAPKTKEVTEPRINLKQEDYARISWKAPAPPAAKPPLKPFNQDECLRQLRTVSGDNGGGFWSWRWEKINQVHHTLSREEAHFWLAVFEAMVHTNNLEGLLKHLEGQVFNGNPEQGKAPSVVGRWSEFGTLFARALWTLYGADGLATALSSLNDWQSIDAIQSLEIKLLPILTAEERKELSDAVSPYLTPTNTPTWALRLGADLGTNLDVLKTIVANLPDGAAKPQYLNSRYSNHYLIAIVGLGDSDLVAAEVNRTNAVPLNAEDARVLLAATEFRCLDRIAESVKELTTKADVEKLAKVIQLAEGPETATVLADIYVNSKVPNVARDWWEKFPTFAIQGLAPLCAERTKRGEAAVEWLNSLKKREGTERIEAALSGLSEPVIQAVREKVLNAAEEEQGEPLADAEAPEWINAVFGGELTIPDAPAEENPPRKLNVTEAERPALLPPLGPTQPLPPIPPFDIDRCLGQLTPLFTGNYWVLTKTPNTFPMTKEEAYFWLEAAAIISTGQWNQPVLPATLETQLRATLAKPTNPVQKLLEQITGLFGNENEEEKRLTQRTYPLSLIPIWTLFGVDGLLKYMLGEPHIRTFGKVILPYITEAQRQEFAKKLPEVVRKLVQQSEHNSHYQLLGALILMELLRFTPEQFESVLSQIPGATSIHYWYSQKYLPYVVRLRSAESIITAAKRLNVCPHDEASARKWLATTDWAGVPALSKVVEGSYYDKAEAAKIFNLVEAPEIARYMVALRKFPSAKLVSRSWLDRFPAFAIEGLAPRILDSDKKEAALATDYLRELKRKGYEWLIQKKLPGFAEPIQNALKLKVLDYDPRKERVVTARDTALAAMLPPVKVRLPAGLRFLVPGQMAMLVSELRTSPLSEPSPTLETVRQNADKLSLDRFVWALFSDWLQEGAPSKDRWKMEALGHLGGDAVALKLTPLVRTWPGESQHQRAVLGLDVLRSIGTDTALMQINGIAQKISFKGIKERAKECMDAIAADRGFSPEELSDRIIPDGGLDERGSRVFDFGPRSFTFALGPDLKPALKDETGKRLPDLPKPNTKDDETRATEAVASWKLLKKQVAEVAKTQAARLEQAMVIGRRWTPTEFQQLLVEHPLMGLLAQRLIWAAYDDTGKPLGTFRVADDRTLADENDELLVIPDNAAQIGIVHPSHLSTGQQGTWGEQASRTTTSFPHSYS
ncbi:MAG: DUF4132 domain-containing protein [Armatimonas sp.]